MNGLIQPAKLGQKSFTVYSNTSVQSFLEFINPRVFFGQWFLLFSMTISIKHLSKWQLFHIFSRTFKKDGQVFHKLDPPHTRDLFYFTKAYPEELVYPRYLAIE
jgi:hypothetical protein